MDSSQSASMIGKYKQIRFIKANPVTNIAASIPENSSKPTTCGEEARSFYETLLAEPSTSTVPDIRMTARLERISKRSR
ncbi:hypothetical protein WUBG_16027, partial [Wuchereria bancrofti]